MRPCVRPRPWASKRAAVAGPVRPLPAHADLEPDAGVGTLLQIRAKRGEAGAPAHHGARHSRPPRPCCSRSAHTRGWVPPGNLRVCRRSAIAAGVLCHTLAAAGGRARRTACPGARAPARRRSGDWKFEKRLENIAKKSNTLCAGI